jgi:hypothetical protein
MCIGATTSASLIFGHSDMLPEGVLSPIHLGSHVDEVSTEYPATYQEDEYGSYKDSIPLSHVIFTSHPGVISPHLFTISCEPLIFHLQSV